MRFLLMVLAALVAATPAASQDVWYENGRPAPSDPSRASSGAFGVMLMITADREGFLQAWAGPTPPTLPFTNEAERNQTVFGMLIFQGCRAGADGNCSVTAEFVILRPDGSPYGESMRGPLWNLPPAPERILLLGATGPGLEVESTDPAGTYLIRAIVTDQVAGISLQVEQPVTVDTPASGDVT